jgi:formate dehydrogenase major subunit
VRSVFETLWGRELLDEPGLRIPNMFDAAIDGTFRAIYVQGEDLAQSDPNTRHVVHALSSLELVVVQDLFLNETARYAHVFLPGTSFLEKDGTFTNAERRINRVRPVVAPRNGPGGAGRHEWQIVCEVAQAMGYPMAYDDAAQIMDEIAVTTPTFAGVSFDLLDTVGSVQWPCNAAAPQGTPIMHVDGFTRGRGRLIPTPFVPTNERSTRRYPLILTTGRILSQYNVGAQTRRTANVVWHPEDVLEVHPHDAEVRGVRDGDLVRLSSRVGQTTLPVRIADRMPVGVVYTTFHHPVTGANIVTTEFSDWATNCPEYKVTAVEVALASAADRDHVEDRADASPVWRANELAAQFRHLGPAEAADALVAHLGSFWEPRMRGQLVSQVADGAPGVDPLVAEAARRLNPPGGN